MAFTLETLAQELGIDPSTLAAKGDVVSKWNGYLSEADNKYSQATRAQKDAEEKFAAVQAEQQAINDQIASFGISEATNAALRANNAAMEASLKELKAQGFQVNIPEAPAMNTPAKNEFDPNAFRQDVNATLIAGFNVNNRYQRLFGQPMPDDVDVLAREAKQANKPFDQYVAGKYDFAGQEKKMADERTAKQKAEWQAEAVKEYREKNPVTGNNPDMQRGVASRFAQVLKPRDVKDVKEYTRLPAKEKISRSLARSMEAISSQAS